MSEVVKCGKIDSYLTFVFGHFDTSSFEKDLIMKFTQLFAMIVIVCTLTACASQRDVSRNPSDIGSASSVGTQNRR